jgi:hypothetical protein
MIVTGIIGQNDNEKTSTLINSILAEAGRKTSIADFKELCSLDDKSIKTYINELYKNDTDMLIFKIRPSEVDGIIPGCIDFNIMIYNDKADDLKGFNIENYKDLIRKIFSMLDEKGTAILNIDYSELIQFLQGMKRHVVSYGFNSKASITASSTGDSMSENVFLCCLQRTISAKNGKLIEPQEYRIKVGNDGFDAYDVLAATTFAVVNGIDIKTPY